MRPNFLRLTAVVPAVVAALTIVGVATAVTARSKPGRDPLPVPSSRP